jgi:phosphoribosyl-ATP pyrophosphohydrolase
MLNLLKRHYQAIVNRGLITKETGIDDFLVKLKEEYNELQDAYNDEQFIQESIDCMCVITNMLQHIGVDIEKELIKNIEVQERRANEIRHKKVHN